MLYKIVVARYNENIEWLTPELHNCIIYNKGEPLHMNEIQLPNVGRESETYLRYIITNYHALPDIVVFTQARISDHKGSDDVNYLIRIKNEANQYKKSTNYITHYQSEHYSYWDKEWNLIQGEYYLPDNYKTKMLFIDWFIANIGEFPTPIKIYANGIFAVKKEQILNKPIEYYQKLLLEVNHHINPSEGHFLERSWYYIFER